MYPLGVRREIANRWSGWALPENAGADSMLVACAEGDLGAAGEVEAWLAAGGDGGPETTAYIDYIKKCREAFFKVEKEMGYFNEDASHSLGHDKWSVGWAGDAIIPLAHFLYMAKSYGLEPVILECGAFKGSSTACLSVACDLIGGRVLCADSFEGLPSDEAHYGKGDFVGTLDEVKDNVEAYGVPSRVDYLQGWYSDTLVNSDGKIGLLWIDVDLQESTLDVLNNVEPKMPTGVPIISDGFNPDVDLDGKGGVNWTGGEPAGFHRYFDQGERPYHAKPLNDRGLALIRRGEGELLWEWSRFKALLDAL